MASLWLVPINTRHMMVMAFESSKQWWPRGRQKIVTVLTTLPPGCR